MDFGNWNKLCRQNNCKKIIFQILPMLTMGMVKNNKYAAELTEDPEVSRQREKRKKRLELLFGDKNLTVEDIVTPICEKELEEEVKRLKEEKEMLMRKDEDSLATEELEEAIKKSKEEYENVMKDMQLMRQQQVGGIEESCEIMHTMCLDVSGYVKKVEQNIKDLEEERDRAQESLKKLREDLQIAKNEEVKNSWADLRNGEGAPSMASMMGKGEPSELKGSLKKMFVPPKN